MEHTCSTRLNVQLVRLRLNQPGGQLLLKLIKSEFHHRHWFSFHSIVLLPRWWRALISSKCRQTLHLHTHTLTLIKMATGSPLPPSVLKWSQSVLKQLPPSCSGDDVCSQNVRSSDQEVELWVPPTHPSAQSELSCQSWRFTPYHIQ